MQLSEVMIGLIGSGLLGLVGWFASRVLNKMDAFHEDIRDLASNHGERIVRLETKAGVLG